ncbi:acyl-CoA thioesterase [Streptococcus ratti]|uniref:Esterase n=1 Tax=Streptococcus ratti FA-1 = DSM 20564 TaxID=699248 RepID=A0ABN0GTN8_STRRT|nr:acyl-CoA thioesterase [Streptococcus ratti]EJN93656.1 esterase [Streptococcus ratti FA-1 = DSM 20564]EMP71218.1 esterase [Streptococcus ratti FA-1 = DSM 20564]QEY07520.1 acyl-CoA thioesterase [Streptococcus ratti]VEI59971.1 esterase [Streptococcus mutans]
MTAYKHLVQYYETDRMGITHHSNYIRWMEEARVHFLTEIGWPYDKLEEEGIISPVVSVSCQYLTTSTFADEISISVKVEQVKAARLILTYKMINQKDDIVCQAQSEHSFLAQSGTFVNIKKEYPDFYSKLSELSQS